MSTSVSTGGEDVSKRVQVKSNTAYINAIVC